MLKIQCNMCQGKCGGARKAIGEGNEIKDDENNGICIAKQIEEGLLKSEKDFPQEKE